MHTLVANDVHYISVYLLEQDPNTGETNYFDLSDANAVVFRMKKYGSGAIAVEKEMEIVNATLGFCRVLVTIPPEGKYKSEIEVRIGSQTITWLGRKFQVVEEIG
ncbi:MAG: hypothetical protein DRJ47_11310 [Thermoprotei archaeon]|nr:MAG: hypothetical protein DRJ47_11310 [Thermoprotei archaeon]